MNIKMVELTVERVVRSQLYLKLKMVKNDENRDYMVMSIIAQYFIYFIVYFKFTRFLRCGGFTSIVYLQSHQHPIRHLIQQVKHISSILHSKYTNA